MILPIQIYGPAMPATIVTTLLTVPINQIWIIKQASITNVNPAATDKLTLYVCPLGEAQSNSNTIYQEEAVSAEQGFNLDRLINVILNGTDVIRGFSQFGNLTLMLNGYRFR